MTLLQQKEKLVLGGNIFGYFTSEKETIDLLHYADSKGVRAVDTADVYSGGLSETFIGKALKNRREKWYLATKVGLASHASPKGLGKKKKIITAVEQSLLRLQTDYIDLYQIHHYDPSTPFEETVDAFESLIQQGKILAAGVSNYTIKHLKEEKLLPGPFSFHQLPLNITDRKSRDLVKMSFSKGLRSIAYGALARGLFSEKYLTGRIPQNSRAAYSQNIRDCLSNDYLEALRKSAEIVHKAGYQLIDVALHYIASFQEAERLIVGCKDKDQLKSVINSLQKPIKAEILNDVASIWEAPLQENILS